MLSFINWPGNFSQKTYRCGNMQIEPWHQLGLHLNKNKQGKHLSDDAPFIICIKVYNITLTYLKMHCWYYMRDTSAVNWKTPSLNVVEVQSHLLLLTEMISCVTCDVLGSGMSHRRSQNVSHRRSQNVSHRRSFVSKTGWPHVGPPQCT